MTSEWLEFSESVGCDIAELLSKAYAGCELFIPMKPTATLKAAMTTEAAERLCSIAGGERVTIPRNHAAALAARNQSVRQGRALGKTSNQLAIEHRTTSRNICRILNGGHSND